MTRQVKEVVEKLTIGQETTVRYGIEVSIPESIFLTGRIIKEDEVATVNEIIQLRKQVEELKEKLARSKGMIEQLTKDQDVDLETLHHDKARLEKERARMEKKYQEILKDYKEKYHDKG
jgi:chromosome segregation ATPase